MSSYDAPTEQIFRTRIAVTVEQLLEIAVRKAEPRTKKMRTDLSINPHPFVAPGPPNGGDYESA
jgi:hypothetical protein